MKRHVNLLPYAHRRSQLVRRRALQWFVLWIATMAAAQGTLWARHKNLQQSTQKLTALQRQTLPMLRLRDQTNELKKQLEELNNQEALVIRLQRIPPMLLVVGMVSQCAQRSDGQIRVQDLVFDWKEVEAKPNAPQETRPANRTPGQMTLLGFGHSGIAVSDFVTSLRGSELFERVELKSSTTIAGQDPPAWSFQIECGL